MSGRPARLEIVQSDSGWSWRFVASNGKPLARSSETYKRERDVLRCVELVFGAERNGDIYEGALWGTTSTPAVLVLWQDERTAR